MKNVLGLLLIITGIILSFYVGVWVCFIGGLLEIIEAVRAEYLVTIDIAIGAAKMLFAGFCGGLSGYSCIIPGYLMLTGD